jgi:hypothetical protein
MADPTLRGRSRPRRHGGDSYFNGLQLGTFLLCLHGRGNASRIMGLSIEPAGKFGRYQCFDFPSKKPVVEIS